MQKYAPVPIIHFYHKKIISKPLLSGAEEYSDEVSPEGPNIIQASKTNVVKNEKSCYYTLPENYIITKGSITIKGIPIARQTQFETEDISDKKKSIFRIVLSKTNTKDIKLHNSFTFQVKIINQNFENIAATNLIV